MCDQWFGERSLLRGSSDASYVSPVWLSYKNHFVPSSVNPDLGKRKRKYSMLLHKCCREIQQQKIIRQGVKTKKKIQKENDQMQKRKLWERKRCWKNERNKRETLLIHSQHTAITHAQTHTIYTQGPTCTLSLCWSSRSSTHTHVHAHTHTHTHTHINPLSSFWC